MKSVPINLTAAIALISMSLVTLVCVSRIVPHAYMDEIFHFPQFKIIHEWIWNKGDWKWDPSITTFPGLYFATSVLLPFSLSSFSDEGLLTMCRGVNAVSMNVLLFYVSKRLAGDIYRGIAMVEFPLNFFFSFLFYTDSAATVSVLLVLVLMRERKFFLSGLAACMSVFMRQTNIVWVFGFCLDECFRRFPKIIPILRDLWPHALLGASFVVFVIRNDFSIVLGHHEHHSFSFHAAQLNYLVLTAVGAAGPDEWFRILSQLRQGVNMKRFALVLIASMCAAELGTVAHPFIYTDNRHYSFYFFRYFIRPRWIRSIIIPFVVACATTSSDLFRANRFISLPVFWLCCALSLVPTPLLEFRYFIVPCLILMAGHRTGGRVSFSALVNLGVMYMFLFRPFRAPDGSTSRFMY